MGLLSLLNIYAAGDSATANLNGHTINDTRGDQPAIAGIRFNTDGTVQQRKASTYTQIDAGTNDWLDGTNDNLWEVRYTNKTGDAFNNAQAATENTWIAISSAREWSTSDTNSRAPGSKSITCDFQIRYNGGAVLTTGSYTFIAEYDDSI